MKEKRKFQKVLAVLMALGMLLQLGGVSYAIDENDEADIDIVLECGMDCDKAQQIINALKGETSEFQGIAPMNILCLFGHSWKQTTSVTTEHRYWQNPTRCRRTTHRVDYCDRSGCNRMDLTLISQIAIVCCP